MGFFSNCTTGLAEANSGLAEANSGRDVSDTYKEAGKNYTQNTRRDLKLRGIPTPKYNPRPAQYETPERRMWPDKCQVCGKGSVNQICVACKPAWSRGLVKAKEVKNYSTYHMVHTETYLRNILVNFRIDKGYDPKLMRMHPETYVELFNDCSIGSRGYVIDYELYGIKVVTDTQFDEGEIRCEYRDIKEEIHTASGYGAPQMYIQASGSYTATSRA